MKKELEVTRKVAKVSRRIAKAALPRS